MANTTAIQSFTKELWLGDTTELTKPATKGRVPDIPQLTDPYQVITGKTVSLYYLVLQVVKSTDKDVVMRAIASAVGIIFKKPTVNFTGARNKPDEHVGLQVLLDSSVAEDAIIETSFEDSEPVTKAEMLHISAADDDEVGAFFGVLFLAGNKKMTAQNRVAFNERRQSAATAGVIGDPVIFVPDSPYLSDAVVQKIYACFTSRGTLRSHMTRQILPLLADATMGPGQAFVAQFTLLVDVGLGGLSTIRQALGMYPWARAAFPELAPAIEAANTAFKLIKTCPEGERSYLKAIHGSRFVPVSYSQISNLVGVCKHIMTYHTATLANYEGGSLTDKQQRVIDNAMLESGMHPLRTPDDDESVRE